jgi:hypothetical protein
MRKQNALLLRSADRLPIVDRTEPLGVVGPNRRPVLARARGGAELKIVFHAHALPMSNHRCGASDYLEQIANPL